MVERVPGMLQSMGSQRVGHNLETKQCIPSYSVIGRMMQWVEALPITVMETPKCAVQASLFRAPGPAVSTAVMLCYVP